MDKQQSKFHVGQLVWHRLFNYRGVIYDVDPIFLLSDEWYERVARSRPPKDEPWYRLLVDGSDRDTYVAERNLRPTDDARPINHPQIKVIFERFHNGRYWPKAESN